MYRALNKITKILFALGAVVLGIAAQSAAQDDTVRIETDTVSVPVTVLDRDGRYIPGLSKENFTIFENGVEQSITAFDNLDVPFTALLLIDTSGSMADHIPSVASAAAEFVNQMRPNDSIAVATFGDDSKIHVVLPPTRKTDLRGRLILRSDPGISSTTTFNAVDLGIEFIEKIKGRKAILLFSDGELFGRGVSKEDNFRKAEESEAMIYTVRFGEYPMYQPGYVDAIMPDDVKRYGNTLRLGKKGLAKLIARVNEYMFGLAERTGGRGFKINAINDLPATFQEIANELGHQYVLSYEPKSSAYVGEKRKITVKVDVPNAAIRSRNEVVFSK